MYKNLVMKSEVDLTKYVNTLVNILITNANRHTHGALGFLMPEYVPGLQKTDFLPVQTDF